MNAFTVDDILEMNPCEEYTRERIEELFAGRETINEFDIDKMPISQEDKGWVLGRMLPWDQRFVFPEGVNFLWVLSNPGLTELNIPEGVNDLWVLNNPGLTELNIPEGVTNLWVENNPGLEE